MGRQNLRIEELFQKIKQQQYRMDKQNQQIQSLQTKVCLFQEHYYTGRNVNVIMNIYNLFLLKVQSR